MPLRLLTTPVPSDEIEPTRADSRCERWQATTSAARSAPGRRLGGAPSSAHDPPALP